MQTRDAPLSIEDRRQALLAGLRTALPAMQSRALQHDRDSTFPAEDMALLRGLGALAAPVPMALGGLGMGSEPAGALKLLDALRLLGRGNLSVGRLYEAHVNALRLVARLGTLAQVRQVAADALAGHLFGLWVTDRPDAPLHIRADGMLDGTKFPCSGAGRVTRALVTARAPSGETLMLVANVETASADLSKWDAHGMRASVSGAVDLTGLPAGTALGNAGDYLRQPDFSAGAWRASAVTLGGLEALVGAFRDMLVARQRAADPHQRARVGSALIAQETARMWVRRAALLGEANEGDAGDIANTVNLARIAVEQSCLKIIHLVQRGLGMAAFQRATLPELLLRDLSFYLRQPAPDETLTEAAGHFMQRDLPPLT
jgi:alkylation response protein AidB-like acyl-CoA dehydrogenase